MIEFEKNLEKVLPYDRGQFSDFLENANTSNINWQGVSFQLPGASEGKHINLKKYIEIYEPLFNKVISKFGNGSFWIVNHDGKDLKWFPNDDDNLNHLRALFKRHDIPDTFRGGITFSMDELLKLSVDLISYPNVILKKDGFLYKDLDISHGELQFIIKISGHLNIDFLSTDKKILTEIVNENSSNLFIIKEYRGNSLD
jgi:hypothetical protein